MGDKSSDRQVLRRIDSETAMRMLNKDRGFCGVCRVIVERSWSGNLGPPTINKVRPTNPKRLQHQRIGKRLQHQRIGSTGEINYEEEAAARIVPHLVRSGGLRRDWSFENLYQNAENWKKNQTAATTKTTHV